MKIVKISAIWCGACLKSNKSWNQLVNNYSFEAVELDYDMDEDEVKKYEVGDRLPVFIFYKGDKEVRRLVGEHSYEEMIDIIEGIDNE